ncbi:MAG: hydroxysqualene dehydroxylase HpnE, partial [Dehalococcoidia bacterium]
MRDGRAEVVIVGGGLAGIAAACELVDRGCAVSLVEKRPFLGGRTYSVTDQRTGAEVDNGQHVFMRCCTEYSRLLRRLGVYERTRLQERMRVLVGNSDGTMAALESSRLPAPFHLLPSFLRFPYLSALDKALALYGLACIKLTTPQQRHALDDITFYQWLVAHRQTERAIRNFWNLVALPTLNDDVHLVSADLALMVFQEGLLGGRGSADIGYATVGLSRLLAQAASDYIQAYGGRLLLARSAAGILCDGGAVAGVALADDEVLTGDFYVSAVPHHALPALLPEELRHSPFFARIDGIGSSPIVNVHLWYDRPVADFDFAAFLDSDVQWVFNKAAILGQTTQRVTLSPKATRLGESAAKGLRNETLRSAQHDGGREALGYLDISLSGARQYIDMSTTDIARRLIDAVGAVLPPARQAPLVRYLVIKQRDATFAAAPGCGRLRPACRTPLP